MTYTVRTAVREAAATDCVVELPKAACEPRERVRHAKVNDRLAQLKWRARKTLLRARDRVHAGGMQTLNLTT